MNITKPLEHMTEYPKKAPMPNGASGIATFYPGVSAQLKEYYRSVEEQGIPDRFVHLLEQLDLAEKRADEKVGSRNARNER